MELLLNLIYYPFIEPGKTVAAIFVMIFLLMAVRDFLQENNAIKRNFPLMALGRYIISSLGPPLRQYLFSNDREERPVPRYIRNWIYASSKNELATVPFGTQLDIHTPGTVLMAHSAFPKKAPKEPSRVICGSERPNPYEVSRFNISAMSFGSLGQNAILSLSKGASTGSFYHNTGEGGVSPYHLQGGADLVWQLGTAKFGARKKNGDFDPVVFKEKAAHPQVKMIEIKLSQGAKPGKGGILPKEKATKEIAKIRIIEPHTDVISPPCHKEWSDAEGMCAFIAQIQELSQKPVGIKFCLGHSEFLDDICEAFNKTGIRPDYIAIDGAEGGTGAAPLAHSNLLGMPMLDAVMATDNALRQYDLRDKIQICASGKVWTGGDLAIALAAGADWAASARGFMLAIGCIQALHCNTNFCPSGVATHHRWLQRGLVPRVNGPRVSNYQHAVLHEFMAVLGSCGYIDPSELSRRDILKVTGWHDIRSMEDLIPYPDAFG